MSKCPKCNNDLVRFYGDFIDVDMEFCPKCGYEVELDTMTCTEPDGRLYVINVSEDEDE